MNAERVREALFRLLRYAVDQQASDLHLLAGRQARRHDQHRY